MVVHAATYRYHDKERSDFETYSLNKQKKLTSQWKKKYEEKLIDEKNPKIDKYPDDLTVYKNLPNLCPVPFLPKLRFPPKKDIDIIVRDKLAKKYKKEYGHLPANINNMKPFDLDTRELIYEGVTREEEGRYAYLFKRKYKIVEDRYKTPITTYWDYGWNLHTPTRKSDYLIPRAVPKYARGKVIEQSFYRNNQVFNPPFEKAGLSMFMNQPTPIRKSNR